METENEMDTLNQSQIKKVQDRQGREADRVRGIVTETESYANEGCCFCCLMCEVCVRGKGIKPVHV